MKYSPQTGTLYKTANDFDRECDKIHIGPITCTDPQGYLRFRLRGKQWKGHQYIMQEIYGHDLAGKEVDHINGIRHDNRLENLRIVDKRTNTSNQHRHRNGKLVGASYNKPRKKWYAKIQKDKKQLHLGCFDTELEAHEAYLKAKAEIC